MLLCSVTNNESTIGRLEGTVDLFKSVAIIHSQNMLITKKISLSN